jgi:hypothetical protein
MKAPLGGEIRLGRIERRGRRYIRVPVHVDGIDSLNAADIVLDYDARAFRFVRARSGQKALVRAGDQRGRARVVLAASQPLVVDNEPILTAIFERRGRRGPDIHVTSAFIDDRPVRIR